MNTATHAYHAAGPGGHVIGWKLDAAERTSLLARFRPRYGEVVADHVTLRDHVDANAVLPPPVQGLIVGHTEDGAGVEALVVQIEGGTGRPDGSRYHITWSLGPGRKAIESNDAIRQHRWQPLPSPIPVRLVPARFP